MEVDSWAPHLFLRPGPFFGRIEWGQKHTRTTGPFSKKKASPWKITPFPPYVSSMSLSSVKIPSSKPVLDGLGSRVSLAETSVLVGLLTVTKTVACWKSFQLWSSLAHTTCGAWCRSPVWLVTTCYNLWHKHVIIIFTCFFHLNIWPKKFHESFIRFPGLALPWRVMVGHVGLLRRNKAMTDETHRRCKLAWLQETGDIYIYAHMCVCINNIK